MLPPPLPSSNISVPPKSHLLITALNAAVGVRPLPCLSDPSAFLLLSCLTSIAPITLSHSTWPVDAIYCSLPAPAPPPIRGQASLGQGSLLSSLLSPEDQISAWLIANAQYIIDKRMDKWMERKDQKGKKRKFSAFPKKI